jgi:atypical dual specificity phosphatase
MSKPGNIWRKVHGKITKKPTNFSWLIEEKLAGSGIPTSFDEFDWLLNQGVKSIVTMTEQALPNDWIQNIGYLHVPTPDLTAPDMDRIDSAVDFIHEKGSLCSRNGKGWNNTCMLFYKIQKIFSN